MLEPTGQPAYFAGAGAAGVVGVGAAAVVAADDAKWLTESVSDGWRATMHSLSHSQWPS